MTRTQLETEISRLLNDTGNTRWSTTVIDDRIELAQKDIVIRTSCLKEVSTFSPVALQQEYALPTDFLSADRMTVDGKDLKYIDKSELDFYNTGDWTESKGTPTNFYLDISTDNLKFGLYPKPDTAGTNTGKLLYVKVPDVLSGASSVPFDTNALLIPYHIGIIYYVVMMCRLDDEKFDSANKYLGLYEYILNEIIDKFGAAKNMQWRLKGGRQWNF